MDALPSIPTPLAHGWRRARQQILPGVVFAVGVVAAAVLWSRWVTPVSMIGEAEVVRAEVRPVQAGVLAGVNVRLLQTVRAGDTLALVAATDPKILAASLAVIRAEIDFMRFTMDPVTGQQRTMLDYERLMLDLMSERVKLASLKSQLHQAESSFARAKSLHEGKLLTDERFEEAQNTRNSLAAQVAAQTELVDRISPELRKFVAAAPGNELPTAAQGLAAALRLQEEKLRLAEAQLQPFALLAPIDGVVTLVARKAGEVVTAGEAVFQVTSPRAEAIVGFIRQPVAAAPAAGQTVEVRTRTQPRRAGSAKVTQVGVHLEPITPTLLAALNLPVSQVPTELGLRVHLALPPELALRPGEQVDLLIRE